MTSYDYTEEIRGLLQHLTPEAPKQWFNRTKHLLGRVDDLATRSETAIRWAVALEGETARLNAELKKEQAENAGLRAQLTAIEAMQVPAQVRASDITGLALGYETALRDMHAALGQAERGEAA